MISQEFQNRRKQLMQKMGKNSVAILGSAPVVQRNGDCDYPYRQHSDFYYLTGFQEPDSVMVLLSNGADGEFILFNRPRDPEKEIWDGARAGQEGAVTFYGATTSFSIHELEKKLPDLLSGRETVYCPLESDARIDRLLFKTLQTLRTQVRNGLQPPVVFSEVSHVIHEMRLIKSPLEIDLMRQAANISAKAHTRAMKHCRPLMNEYQLVAELNYEFQRHGSQSLAYNTIVGSGANTCVLHYVENNKVIQDGELVLIDAGCEFHYYASDVTRTFPANGRFSAEQAAIYDLVLDAQLAAIELIKPGLPFDKMQEVIVAVLTEGLMKLGLLKGDLKKLIEQQAYFPFYMHKSGHWLGLDVHDVGRYKINGQWRTLEAGMVLTVEPGLYLSGRGTDIPSKWHHIGVRIEDDVLVTENGFEVLSHAAPKCRADVEQTRVTVS